MAENLPAKTHYTKKIVVLINGETFSAGEFLAAILQDNERATLFGTTTGAEAVAQSAYAIKP
ncbi:S41 family peptidase [Tunturibacter psychrotolerans]|uniref:S41 family peptidase n=1 Tax=Tunturiibacter psychrotolerans TaxID=3069686 RepID=A0AAU7ZQT1_9BACT